MVVKELEAARAACQESDLLLVEADARALAAVTSATAQQEELLQVGVGCELQHIGTAPGGLAHSSVFHGVSGPP